MSLSVVPHAVEQTKRSVTEAVATATRHGIKPSASLCSVSRIIQSLLRRAGNMNIYLVLSCLKDCYRAIGRSILPILCVRGEK